MLGRSRRRGTRKVAGGAPTGESHVAHTNVLVGRHC